MKILVIEDEKMLADSIKAMLQRNGFPAGQSGQTAGGSAASVLYGADRQPG